VNVSYEMTLDESDLATLPGRELQPSHSVHRDDGLVTGAWSIPEMHEAGAENPPRFTSTPISVHIAFGPFSLRSPRNHAVRSGRSIPPPIEFAHSPPGHHMMYSMRAARSSREISEPKRTGHRRIQENPLSSLVLESGRPGNVGEA